MIEVLNFKYFSGCCFALKCECALSKHFKNKTVDLVRNGGSKMGCIEKSIPQAGQNDSFFSKECKIHTCIYLHMYMYRHSLIRYSCILYKYLFCIYLI